MQSMKIMANIGIHGFASDFLSNPKASIRLCGRWFRSMMLRKDERARILELAKQTRAQGGNFSAKELAQKLILVEQTLYSLRKYPGGKPPEDVCANYLRLLFLDKTRSCWIGFAPASGGSLVSSVVSYYLNRRYGGQSDMSDFSIFAPSFGEAKYLAPLIDVKFPYPCTSLEEFCGEIRAEYLLGGHMPFDEIPLLDVAAGRVLLAIRDIYSAAYSSARHHYLTFGFKFDSDGRMREKDLIASLRKLRWMFVRWYNSWGNYLFERGQTVNVRVTHFEEMKLNAIESFRGILSFITEVPVDDETLQEAVAAADLSAEKERYDRLVDPELVTRGEQHRIGYQAAVSYREVMSAAFHRAVEDEVLGRLDRFGWPLAERSMLKLRHTV